MILTIGIPVREVTVRGATAAADPTLGGTVLVDEIRAFNGTYSTSPPTPPSVPGKMQVRVVRQNDGKLAFYYRVTELRGGNIEYIAVTQFTHSACRNYDVDFRTDGLGVVGPSRVSTNGEHIMFEFADSPITPARLSRFMFIRPMAGPLVTTYNTRAEIVLGTQGWWAQIVNCFAPVWT